MAYAVENALYQWRDGERRISEAPEPAQADLERAADAVVEELRRRLGSSFVVDELADLYARDTDWALELARRNTAGSDAASVVDAAFARYLREAKDYAGGRPREKHEKPD
ncbi:MAG TPA: hypothetical protein VK486_10350 [Thermoleophilaceae bacterium]|nr:hypothetical protein [Thermoleophilaceae bacterium]